MQIFQGTQRKAVTPISLLAKAYRAKNTQAEAVAEAEAPA
jgi:hypothetical protein